MITEQTPHPRSRPQSQTPDHFPDEGPTFTPFVTDLWVNSNLLTRLSDCCVILKEQQKVFGILLEATDGQGVKPFPAWSACAKEEEEVEGES